MAKFQKFVDAQFKKGVNLPKYDATWDNTHYEWVSGKKQKELNQVNDSCYKWR